MRLDAEADLRNAVSENIDTIEATSKAKGAPKGEIALDLLNQKTCSFNR